MLRELETTALCMFLSTELHRPLPTNWRKFSLTLRKRAPSASVMILCCRVLYHGYLLLSLYRSGVYLLVFSAHLISLLLTHGQLISSRTTFFFLSITVQSILLFLTSAYSAYSGTSQSAFPFSFSSHSFLLLSLLLSLFFFKDNFIKKSVSRNRNNNNNK